MNADSKIDSDSADNKLPLSRRGFLGSAGVGAAALSMAAVGATLVPAEANAGFIPHPSLNPRGLKALRLRVERATFNLAGLVPDALDNGDESNLANFAASYSKGLPHDANGEVSPAAYTAMKRACKSNLDADWNLVPMGGTTPLVSPQAGVSYQMEGADPARLRIPPAPRFDSEARAAQMAELYWMALLRDVPFADYAQNALAQEAVSDLRRFTLFSSTTSDSLFRGLTAGQRTGPYVSQFLLQNIPFGPTNITQQYAAGTASVDFMTSLPECLSIQNGNAPTDRLTLVAPGFIRSGRDLCGYVHRDFSYQAFLNAALIALGYGEAALDDANPYKNYDNRRAFVSFGVVEILSNLAQVSLLAMKAAWYQKWSVNRTLRPEAFALRVHQDKTNTRAYPIHGALLSSTVLDKLHSRHGSYLLPMAFPEGSPSHPSFPSGHATIAGACATVLKACFNERFVVPAPVVASADGLTLNAYAGGALSLGGELDKLASNVAIARNISGVHYWSDAIEGMNLGEQVALAFLRDMRGTCAETFAGFSLTRFDGTTVNV